MADNLGNNKKDIKNNDPKNKKTKVSLYWIYGILAIFLLLLQFLNFSSGARRKVLKKRNNINTY